LELKAELLLIDESPGKAIAWETSWDEGFDLKTFTPQSGIGNNLGIAGNSRRGDRPF
jgi:hypothetical protein